MIFVTVGTHEQQFNRLVEKIDQMKEQGLLQEEIVIQTGYSDYQPKSCKWEKFFSYHDMRFYTSQARIVISHGGPSSFMMPLEMGKTPIVVPRQYQYGEHVNNHQLDFCHAVERQCSIILVDDITELENVVLHYDEYIASGTCAQHSHTREFTEAFSEIMTQLIEKK